ncbi:MAG: sigma-54 dependent transcriptional regulator [Victivallales bacterium]|nr:sigma-54 dependent transcriptional regulator [Victivallales bacterium]
MCWKFPAATVMMSMLLRGCGAGKQERLEMTVKKHDKANLLIVDDERNTRDALRRYFCRDFAVTTAEDGLMAINLLKTNDYDLVLTDLKMPGAGGMSVLDATLGKNPPPPCIVFTAYGSIETAVSAVKAGAFDFVTKPVDLEKLEAVLKRALEARKIEDAGLAESVSAGREIDLSYIVAESKAMREILQTVRQVASSRSTVLLSGESGTGKEVIAQALHLLSGRKGKFIPVHCAALAANLLESELFGHEKGAFTGAIETRQGRFELADGGTLFLDEISEIDPQVQVKLLRVLETRSFERVGGVEPITTKARLISATNRDLMKMVKEGTFREDLFYRLDVVNIMLPPLRERREDIPVLTRKFITEFATENGKNISGISAVGMDALLNYSWPGNIRELRNCIERMVVLCPGNSLGPDDLPVNVRNGEMATSGERQNKSLDINENEVALISRALQECNGNRTQAARKLGISRRTLHRRLHEYNLL